MALVMLHKLLPMFVNRKTIVLGTGMAFLLAQTLVHLFHVAAVHTKQSIAVKKSIKAWSTD